LGVNANCKIIFIKISIKILIETDKLMRQSTLDLIDSELRREYNRYQGFPYEDRYKIFTTDMRLDPYWSSTKFQSINVSIRATAYFPFPE
jgi:hypothetical protein